MTVAHGTDARPMHGRSPVPLIEDGPSLEDVEDGAEAQISLWASRGSQANPREVELTARLVAHPCTTEQGPNVKRPLNLERRQGVDIFGQRGTHRHMSSFSPPTHHFQLLVLHGHLRHIDIRRIPQWTGKQTVGRRH